MKDINNNSLHFSIYFFHLFYNVIRVGVSIWTLKSEREVEPPLIGSEESRQSHRLGFRFLDKWVNTAALGVIGIILITRNQKSSSKRSRTWSTHAVVVQVRDPHAPPSSVTRRQWSPEPPESVRLPRKMNPQDFPQIFGSYSLNSDVQSSQPKTFKDGSSSKTSEIVPVSQMVITNHKLNGSNYLQWS